MIRIEKQIRQAIRDAVNRNSRKPFFWGGLRGYQQLEAIGQALEQLEPEDHESSFLRLLNQRVKKVLVSNNIVAQDLKAAHHLLSQIAHCFSYPPGLDGRKGSAKDEKPGSQSVAKEIGNLLGQFHPSGKLRQAQMGLLSAAKRRWDLFGPELLHCYDIPGLPQDNLQLESLFGRLRRHQRRISGCKSTRELHDFGQVQVLFKAESEQNLLHMIQQVSHEDYRSHRQRLSALEAYHQFFRRLHHDPFKTLQSLVGQHKTRQKLLTRSLSSPLDLCSYHTN